MTPPLTRAALLRFLRGHRYAVQSSIHPAGVPQSAVVGIAVSDDFEIVFDTLATTRKAHNLRHRGAISFVIGGLDPNDERSVQYEGIADEPAGADRSRLTALYYAVFPDGPARLQWPGLIYIRATPVWLRFSDHGQDPPVVHELDGAELRALK